jgi:hypothetical protein
MQKSREMVGSGQEDQSDQDDKIFRQGDSGEAKIEIRDGNGYPPPIYPRVKTLFECGFGRFCPPRVC